MKKLNTFSLLNFFQQTHLILGIGAALITYQTAAIFSFKSKNEFLIPLFVFFSTLFAYSVFRLKLNLTEGGQKKLLISLHAASKIKIVTAFSSLFFSLVFFFQMVPMAQSLVIIVAMATFLYVAPVSLNGNAVKGIRNIFILKSIWLALVWTITTAVLPMLNSNENFPFVQYFNFIAQRFCFIFSIALAFNIRDYYADRAKNLKTIPGIFGISFTKVIAVGILLAGGFSICLEKNIAHTVQYGILISMIYTAILILVAKPGVKNFFYSVLMDGALAVQAFLVFLMSMFFH